MSRSEIKFIAENNGGKVLGSVSKKLDYLIVGDSKPTKKKIDQAKNLNVKILSEKEWKKMLNGWTSFYEFQSFIFRHKIFYTWINLFMVGV